MPVPDSLEEPSSLGTGIVCSGTGRMTEDHRNAILSFPWKLPPGPETPESSEVETPPEDTGEVRLHVETPATPAANRLRVARILVGRCRHSLALACRRWWSAIRKRQMSWLIAGLRQRIRALIAVAGRHPRKTAIIVGAVLCTVIAARWKSGSPKPDDTMEGAGDTPKLGTVVVYPPDPKAKSAAPDAAPGKTADNFPGPSKPGPANKVQSSNPQGQFPANTGIEPSPFPSRTPPTPRAVWLTGKIEELRETPRTVRPTSHIDVPMSGKRKVAPVSLRDIEQQRRYRR